MHDAIIQDGDEHGSKLSLKHMAKMFEVVATG